MLTEKQEAILAFIQGYQRQEGVPPSSRSVQQRFGFKTQTSAMRHLRRLGAAGELVQFPDKRWGIKQPTALSFEIPVYGSIPAGAPAFREQQPEGTVPLDANALNLRAPLWAVRISGDSMVGDHLLEGDLAIFEKRQPHYGEVIAALVDGTHTTLKRLISENGRVGLRASNPRYPDVFPETIESQGVLVAILRTQFEVGVP